MRPSLKVTVRPVRPWCSALGAIAVDHDLAANRKVGLAETTPQQRRRSARFDRPVDDFAVSLFDVDVNPPVRIHPIHTSQHALQLDRLVDIEFRRKE